LLLEIRRAKERRRVNFAGGRRGTVSISDATLFTVERIRFTAAVILPESVGLEMWAACSNAGRL